MIQDQRFIRVCDWLLSDDFCEDAEMRLVFDKSMSPTEKEAIEKLEKLYRLAHGLNKENSCYSVHKNWRAEFLKIERAMKRGKRRTK